ncbi:antitermination regulator [Streptomyces sp. CB02923]|uniref:ANTAR domain-containing protein n=1 Tax=Streptomyces sp. CB02923 TaxID=1718985 RepID=UPI0009405902|nr:ANTAR domain-containing protein [Streptomyces sp. CB02923]OKH98962.1 antitermination regulator [Streptomyces sp. CB02923]
MPEAARWARLPEDPAEGKGSGGAPAAFPPVLSRIDGLRGGDRTGVAVQGELDLDACVQIERDLYAALSCSSKGIDLHLDAVPFCDCAGLNMLLRLRLRAVAQGKSVVIRSSSRAVDRLLELSEARELFVSPNPNPNPNHNSDCMPDPAPGPHESGLPDLPAEVAQLRRAMETRPAIDLARGILMATFTLSPEAAWAVLVSASQNTNIKLHLLAQDLVNSVQGAALPEVVQGQLGAAVAKAKAAPVPAPRAQPSTATVE